MFWTRMLTVWMTCTLTLALKDERTSWTSSASMLFSQKTLLARGRGVEPPRSLRPETWDELKELLAVFVSVHHQLRHAPQNLDHGILVRVHRVCHHPKQLRVQGATSAHQSRGNRILSR